MGRAVQSSRPSRSQKIPKILVPDLVPKTGIGLEPKRVGFGVPAGMLIQLMRPSLLGGDFLRRCAENLEVSEYKARIVCPGGPRPGGENNDRSTPDADSPSAVGRDHTPSAWPMDHSPKSSGAAGSA